MPLTLSRTLSVALCGLALAQCTQAQLDEQSAPRSLSAYPNPFGPDDALWSAQPHREKPLELVLNLDGTKAYVSLQGTPDAPGGHVVVLDTKTHEVLERIEVGASPTGLALHPDGKLLLVLNRFSNFASVIDTTRDEVIQSPPMDFYAIEAVFSPDGRRLYVTNRWHDTMAIYDVEAESGGLRFSSRLEPGVPVGQNPRDIAVSQDGKMVAVAALTGLTVSLIDAATGHEKRRIDVGAPVNDLLFAGEHLIVATLSASTHHLADAGPDTDGDGMPGDGTPNVNFQDLQNEIAVYSARSGDELWRYTSDSICCKDYRDVSPEDVERLGYLLPPKETWIVGGALPEQLALMERGGKLTVLVTYSASNEVQAFEIDAASGALSAGLKWGTAGHNPHGLVVAGEQVVVAHRLSESVGFYDVRDGTLIADVTVGDVSGGAFPATDAELGELVNFVTATFSVDGDQSCAHCHREDGNIDKAFSMPLTRYGGVGSRQTMAYRGSADTRPWFFESSMDETNFKPVINEFARIENFCCSDYTLWPDGAPRDCAENPPDACTEAPNTSSLDGFAAVRIPQRAYVHRRPAVESTRDQFYLNAIEALTGRTRSFADGLYFEDPLSEERRSVRLDFSGITRALGLFLLVTPKLLPNPNPLDTASAKRGRALFESASTGCSACHPSPTFAVSTTVNPLGSPIRMGPVVASNRASDGTNLDLFAAGFVQTFPQSEMDSCEEICGEAMCEQDSRACDNLRDVYFGVPSLRGIWDRAQGMLHDGRARGLREVLATPGHPVLEGMEVGHNERDGVVDSHGGTSHLTPQQIRDLVNYMKAL